MADQPSADVVDVASLPLPPVNPLPRKERLAACRSFHTGTDVLRDAGGPVTRFTLAPKWLMPPLVVVTSPQGIRDTVTCRDGSIDKTSDVSQELERIIGANMFVVNYEQWKPRRRTIQPVFTKQSVNEFGGHMSAAAESVCNAWEDGAEIDVDAAARRITMRALGHSVFGLDLTDHADIIDAPMRVAVSYAVSRAISPVSLPRWVPTRTKRRALQAAASIREFALGVVRACRENPDMDAPLVQQLIAATDPETGKPLSDLDIANELLIFMFAGQDTTATTIAYSLWALGRNRDIQDRVVAEVTQFGDRELTPDDVPQLGYTIQVLKESMRLCPPGATGSRMATRDVAVAGYRIPAGTMIVMGRMSVHRDPTLWDRPLVFDPDRFTEENSKARDPWQYVPFGRGPRGCIGDHFAMLEATLALATIVRHAQIDSLDDDFPMIAPFTLVAGGPVRARIKLRR
ncbi:cytochrome P450 [Mycobacterium sp. CBMA293]|uniref:cytochrome P450 n=1 Tax=unclassified Mycolicibacterium TaxID=2636767 RepID=UPI0012DD8352|nr:MULTISPECIES: cytochrome P450 [unclassified Mycolicibacterium]MUL49974.1 cytochrome P450 [Mycolicibacterium sp. CBMA 360]MUL61579.1 cytochrome P450 [Mycolicibacterium sp. CBMA 335]MUL74314.1 cytochrome P450 [Mycolicibacterium sp. CBMA 311]MUL96592.1 cytochrome P450 [Mycolicibacterium sp. CBMA 230]MUM04250.1 cytochrome P450 [Mycolicibacterium sp. CBMA 213]